MGREDLSPGAGAVRLLWGKTRRVFPKIEARRDMPVLLDTQRGKGIKLGLAGPT
jgi:hypothetical protein